MRLSFGLARNISSRGRRTKFKVRWELCRRLRLARRKRGSTMTMKVKARGLGRKYECSHVSVKCWGSKNAHEISQRAEAAQDVTLQIQKRLSTNCLSRPSHSNMSRIQHPSTRPSFTSRMGFESLAVEDVHSSSDSEAEEETTPPPVEAVPPPVDVAQASK